MAHLRSTTAGKKLVGLWFTIHRFGTKISSELLPEMQSVGWVFLVWKQKTVDVDVDESVQWLFCSNTGSLSKQRRICVSGDLWWPLFFPLQPCEKWRRPSVSVTINILIFYRHYQAQEQSDQMTLHSFFLHFCRVFFVDFIIFWLKFLVDSLIKGNFASLFWFNKNIQQFSAVWWFLIFFSCVFKPDRRLNVGVK